MRNAKLIVPVLVVVGAALLIGVFAAVDGREPRQVRRQDEDRRRSTPS